MCGDIRDVDMLSLWDEFGFGLEIDEKGEILRFSNGKKNFGCKYSMHN